MMFLISNFLKRSVSWSLFLCISITSYAQQFEWAQSFGGLGLDAGREVTSDEDGNVFLVGSFSGSANIGGTWYSGNGVQEAFVAKFNSAGTLMWVNLISGPEEDLGRGAVTDNLGNVYMVGHYTDTVSFYRYGQTLSGTAGSEGGQDIFVVKYGPNGNLLWFRTYGGTGDDTATDIDWYQWSNKLYVTGGFQGRGKFGTETILSNGLSDAFLMKVDSEGNTHWVRHGGGAEHDVAAAVAVEHGDELIYMVGDFYSEAYFDGSLIQSAGSSDMFLAKFDHAGNQIWINTNGGTNVDVATSVGVDQNRFVYVSGYYQLTTVFQSESATAEGYNDVFLSRFDEDGNCNWLTSVGSNALDNCLGMDVRWDGTTYLTGMFENELFFGDSSVQGNGYDAFILCHEPSGSLRYVKTAGAGQSDFGMAICLGSDESLYMAGYYYFYADFDEITIGNAENGDGFLAKLTDIVGVSEPVFNSKDEDCLMYNRLVNSIEMRCDYNREWRLINAVGQLIASGNASEMFYLPPGLNGVHFLEIIGENKRHIKKLVMVSE